MVEALDNRVNLEDVDIQKTRPFVVVGIPAYNEEKSIAGVVLRSQKFADKVVVCDDGSVDMTAEIAKRLDAEVIQHKENLGYGGALRSLFLWAKEYGADVLVTLDGDGQHDPSEILAIVEPIAEGRADVVVGSRFVDSKNSSEMPSYRRFGAKVITKLVNGSKMGISDAQSGFRAYSREALNRLGSVEAGMGASIEILLDAQKKNLRICEVPASCKYKNGNVATSTNHPVQHGASVVMSIIRIIIEKRNR